MVTPNTNGINGHKRKSPRLYSLEDPPQLDQLIKICSNHLTAQDCPLAESITSNIPVYNIPPYSQCTSEQCGALQDEWYDNLLNGSGVIVLKNFLPKPELISRTNEIFDRIIRSEAATSRGDHFAASGKNSRIWNSFQKHALQDAESFIEYYSNPWLAVVCEAWLGPAYRITAQLNIVRPGGAPQVSHRDYHLGFQTAESCVRFPKAMQIASQLLTLQGGIAHSDVPLQSGPTRFLPFSQKFEEGFMAYRLPEFQEWFNQHWVSLELKKGDAVFFNPALFHAAGENQTSDVHRSVNLLQISSAFGKSMESIDTLAIVRYCWTELRRVFDMKTLTEKEVRCIVVAMGDGYPFPTNLDKRPPAPGGMAPACEVDVLLVGLEQGHDTEQVCKALEQLQVDSRA